VVVVGDEGKGPPAQEAEEVGDRTDDLVIAILQRILDRVMHAAAALSHQMAVPLLVIRSLRAAGLQEERSCIKTEEKEEEEKRKKKRRGMGGLTSLLMAKEGLDPGCMVSGACEGEE